MIIIKPMETEEEIRGKAYVHWKSWQETYRGIVHDAYLDALTYEKCLEIAQNRANTLVMKDGERDVIGFAAYGKTGEETGEVFAIYVLEAYQKKRLGYALMNWCRTQLKDCKEICVRTLKDNRKAIAFYERYGFRPDGTEETLTLGKPVTAIRMVYEMQSRN